jgi:hypothetical protein
MFRAVFLPVNYLTFTSNITRRILVFNRKEAWKEEKGREGPRSGREGKEVQEKRRKEMKVLKERKGKEEIG